MDYQIARHNMVENQVRTNKVTDPLVIAAMEEVPRELFLPEGKRGIAYVDGCGVCDAQPGNDNETCDLFMDQMRSVMQKTAGIRRYGAAALDLAYVAAGRYDGFWENGLEPWDVAAGLLLVREAGGFVTNLEGQRYDLGAADILATNEGLHRKLTDLLVRDTP